MGCLCRLIRRFFDLEVLALGGISSKRAGKRIWPIQSEKGNREKLEEGERKEKWKEIEMRGGGHISEWKIGRNRWGQRPLKRMDGQDKGQSRSMLPLPHFCRQSGSVE